MEMSAKMKDAYVQRMPSELKEKFVVLPVDEQDAIIKALVRVHQVIEEETFQFLLGIVSARKQKQ
ncbi:MAG: hypothetical protein NWF01_05210 [Candidatus Bathyarchaeota archaeon]|nr:hypothetical protein [Candidatus Bathyarchaeota archaeon]